MLNFIYYPVSAILWFWHQVFGYVLGPDNGFAWALSVIFLVFTLRALLIKPFVGQVRSMRKMQEFSPQIKKLQEKYKGDKTKLAEEMQKLQKEHGVNPLGGCLPVLVQLPVFIGLFHVLRGFRPEYAYNYVFDKAGIDSFLAGDIFGVRLDEAISGGMQALGSFSLGGGFNPHVIPVALPLMIIASVATHFTARVSQQHQSPAAAANPQAAIMGKLTMWLFPLGVLVFGVFFPVAILLYWLSNNSWTLTQQYLVYNKIAREDEEKRVIAREQRDMLAPKPGQKPQRQRGGSDAIEGDGLLATETTVIDDEPQDAVPEIGRAPAPGARPARNGPKKGATTSGRAAPGKVGSSPGGGNGSGKNGSSGHGAGGNGANGTANGSGANGKRGGKGRAGSGNATPGKVKSGGGKNGSARNGSGKKKG